MSSIGHDPGDDALVAVATGHLVAFRQLALLGDADTHHLLDAGGQVACSSRRKTLTSTTLPRSPWGRRSEVSFTSRAFSPKMARSSFSSGVSSVSPFGVILPTRMSPGLTSAPMRMMPSSSRSFSASSPTFGMSRVISSGPSLVSRASISCFSMWIEVNLSCSDELLADRRWRPQSCRPPSS